MPHLSAEGDVAKGEGLCEVVMKMVELGYLVLALKLESTSAGVDATQTVSIAGPR